MQNNDMLNILLFIIEPNISPSFFVNVKYILITNSRKTGISYIKYDSYIIVSSVLSDILSLLLLE
jgi:hypothetical protein